MQIPRHPLPVFGSQRKQQTHHKTLDPIRKCLDDADPSLPKALQHNHIAQVQCTRTLSKQCYQIVVLSAANSSNHGGKSPDALFGQRRGMVRLERP